MTVYRYSNSTINIPLDAAQHKGIGIRLSGGADSAILFAMLCETIISNGDESFSTIYPLTMNYTPKPFNVDYSKRVIKFIKECYPTVNIADTTYYTSNGPESDYADAQKRCEVQMYKDGIITIIFGGVTQNPPIDDIEYKEILESMDESNERDYARDATRINRELFIGYTGLLHANPFIAMHKRDVNNMYELLSLKNSLLPITRSCESFKNFDTPCKECWWCKERLWGFGTY